MFRPGFDEFASALFAGAEIFHALKDSLRRRGHATAVGDEGGFAPDLRGTREALDLLMESIVAAGFEPGREVMLALDCAASEFCNSGVYELPGENFRGDSAALTEWLAALRDDYPIASIEDGCDENDWEGWRRLTERLGGRTQLVGDDLFATNIARLQKGADSGAANALLAKPNQIGTVTETKEAAAAARRLNYRVILSHRSGDTERAEFGGFGGGVGRGTNQNRRALSRRAHRQIQPPSDHRRRVGRGGDLSWRGRFEFF